MADFQKLGQTVQKMRTDGVSDADINGWLSQAGTNLEMLNASGFGPESTRARAPTGKMDAVIQGAGQGLSMGFGDEVAAAAAATLGTPEGYFQPQGENWTDRYTSARDQIRGKLGEIQEDNPGTYATSQVAGALAPALLPTGRAMLGTNVISNAPNMLSMMGRSAAFGAGYGGLSALGQAQGTPGEQAVQTAVGTAAGGVLGAGIPPLVKGAAALPGKVRSLLTPNRMISEAAPVAQQISTQLPAQTAGAPAQGVPQSPLIPRAITKPLATASVSQSDRLKAISEMGRALTRAGYSTDDAARAIKGLGPQATLADISNATQRLLRTAKSGPGAAGDIITTALENRQAGQQGRLLAAAKQGLAPQVEETKNYMSSRFGMLPLKLSEVKQLPDDIYQASGELIKMRSTKSNAAYEAFRKANGGVTWSDDLAKLFERPSLKKAYSNAVRIAADEGVDLPRIAETDPLTGEVTKWVAVPDNRTLDFIKRGLDDVIEGARDQRGKITTDAGRAVQSLKTQFLDVVDDLNPAYKIARDTYSGPSQSLKALELGRKFLTEDAEMTAAEIAKLPKGDKEFFRAGVLRAVSDIIKSNPADRSVVNKLRSTIFQEKLKEAFPSRKAFDEFVKEVERESIFAGTRSTALGGSQTAEKLLDASDLARNTLDATRDAASGNVGGLLARGAEWLGRLVGPGEGTRAVLGKGLMESDPVAIQQILSEIARVQRLQAASNQAASTGAIGGAVTGGPAASQFLFGRQP